MLISGCNDGHVSFEMNVVHQSSINIDFACINDCFLHNKYRKKVVFIDPIVLANQCFFLDLESQDSNLILVPTNLYEANKNIDSLMSILAVIEDQGVGRKNDMIFAIGGGALLDAVSMAASIFRRGIHVTKVPTTLLGIVDASIGIKTGINFLGQRNRLGSYHFDYSVVVDPRLMQGLHKNLVRQGLGEIFKIAVIKSRALFDLLLLHSSRLEDVSFYAEPSGLTILQLSIQLMLEELHDNPREDNLKRNVDFGHSFSPLVEMESISRHGVKSLPHGFSVAFDCLLTSTIAYSRGLLPEDQFSQILSLYMSFDFGFNNDIYRDEKLLWSSFLEMTKHRGGNQNLPLPISVGNHIFIQDLSFDELRSCLSLLKSFTDK